MKKKARDKVRASMAGDLPPDYEPRPRVAGVGKPPLTIRISGFRGSGKTTVAAIIIDALIAAGWHHITSDEPDCFAKPHRPVAGWRPREQAILVVSNGRQD